MTKKVNFSFIKCMKETEKTQKGYGGPPKCLHLFLVGHHALNVKSHYFQEIAIEINTR